MKKELPSHRNERILLCVQENRFPSEFSTREVRPKSTLDWATGTWIKVPQLCVPEEGLGASGVTFTDMCRCGGTSTVLHCFLFLTPRPPLHSFKNRSDSGERSLYTNVDNFAFRVQIQSPDWWYSCMINFNRIKDHDLEMCYGGWTPGHRSMLSTVSP